MKIQTTLEKQPLALLKQYFGYKQFRPMQAEIIDTVLQQKDALVLMPTGGGKSICYQIPALAQAGLGIVVSPLIALMKDQVESLILNGVTAAFINSTQSRTTQNQIAKACLDGEIKLLYVSPEKLLTPAFLNFLPRLNVNLFAIDEAHCVSFWGHDFRPEYTQLQIIKEKFPNIPIIALTATADKVTRGDITKQLALQTPKIFISSFDRPNLSLSVRPGQKRVQQILTFLEDHSNDSGIIYCLSRKSTEQLAAKLVAKGFDAAPYHAQLEPTLRANTQERFLKDELQIVCATIAFGMGIDKSNIRFVIHYNLPKNIESYYQEIGRAGRDGLASKTMLFYTYADVKVQREWLQAERSNIQQLKLAKLERLQQFAEAHVCRRKILLNYFNEELKENCGNCDVCKNPRETFDGTVIAQKAFSAILRAKQQIPLKVVIEVLRGNYSYRVKERRLQNIKTFGAGKDVSPKDWQNYLLQLINLGYIEIAYDQNYVLHLTNKGKAVLFEQKSVQLVNANLEVKAKPVKKKAMINSFDKALYEELRALRAKIAEEKSVPAYIIFGNKVLEAMAGQIPVTEEEMLQVSGVGTRKMAFYGAAFLQTIQTYITTTGKQVMELRKQQLDNAKTEMESLQQALLSKLYQLRLQLAKDRKVSPDAIFSDFSLQEMVQYLPTTVANMMDISGVSEQKMNLYGQQFLAAIVQYTAAKSGKIQSSSGKKVKAAGATHDTTLELFQSGKTPQEIAAIRSLALSTIEGHLLTLYKHDKDIDLHRLIPQETLPIIVSAIDHFKGKGSLRDVYDYLDQKYTFGQLRFAVAWREKEQ